MTCLRLFSIILSYLVASTVAQSCISPDDLSPVYVMKGGGLSQSIVSLPGGSSAGVTGPKGETGEKGQIGFGVKGEPGLNCDCCERIVRLESRVGKLMNFCQRVASSASTTFVTMSNGFQYHLSSTSMNFHDAREYCASKGATVAHLGIREPATRSILHDHISAGNEQNVWIGLTDEGTEDVFVWEDGTPLDPAQSEWSRSEPNNYGSGEDCVMMYHENHWKWNDDACDSNWKVLCERPITSICKIFI